MLEENENLVEESTENVEQQTTEENVESEEVEDEVESTDVENTESNDEESQEQEKHYTEEEMNEIVNEKVDAILAKKIARKEAKIRKEYEKKYGRAETVLKAGLQKDNFEEAVSELENFYTQEGVQIPQTHSYSKRETEILAKAEADEIIDAGYDEIVEEVDRLASIGVDNMSDADKIIFSKLAEERKRIEENKDLASIGLTRESLTDDFKEFAKNLDPNMSIKKQYEFYQKFKPKKEVRKMGSMESGSTSKVKDHYTAEEISRLTEADLDNPDVWKAVRQSMTNSNYKNYYE